MVDDFIDPDLNREYARLEDYNTVYQAEVYAIIMACLNLHRQHLTEPITIFSDSQSALQALASPTTESALVLRCKQVLHDVSILAPVTLKWIKAHVGHFGNEMADHAARRGTEVPLDYDEFPPPAPPLSYIKSRIREGLRQEWNTRWQNLTTCRQTKLWFPSLDLSKSKQLMKLSRPSLSILVQAITGHNSLAYHESKLNPGFDPACDLCDSGERQTTEHLTTQCDAFWYQRSELFGEYTTTLPREWSVAKLAGFLRVPSIGSAYDRRLIE